LILVILFAFVPEFSMHRVVAGIRESDVFSAFRLGFSIRSGLMAMAMAMALALAWLGLSFYLLFSEMGI